jgi:hypothetical protein
MVSTKFKHVNGELNSFTFSNDNRGNMGMRMRKFKERKEAVKETASYSPTNSHLKIRG